MNEINIDPKIHQYRLHFRENILPKYYSGKLHLYFLWTFIPLLGFATLLQVKKFEFSHLVVVFTALIYCNAHIYLVHRFLLHKHVIGYKWANKMHMIHHRLYSEKHMEYEQLNDIYMLLMPPMIAFLYYFFYCPIVLWLFSFVFQGDSLIIFASLLFMWFGYYELVHYIQHLRDDHILMKIPYCRYLKRFHTQHHRHNKMNKVNFDIAIPSFDYLFKTNYKG